MKKFNMNDFTIDDVFKKLDKKAKTKAKKESSNNKKSDASNCYTIEINV